MSVPNRRLVLTKRAQRDLRDIQAYTLREWGPEQADDYERALDHGLELLRDRPHIGTHRNELRPGLMGFPVERHVVFYRARGETVTVVRILHERADAARRWP